MKAVKSLAVLLGSAAFVYCPVLWSQVPVVDLNASTAQPAAQTPAPLANSQGELFYQLQLLQQEVMQLRGLVEEQSHQLQKLKQQGMERYIDVDRRLGQLAGQAVNPASATQSATTTVDDAPVAVGAPVVVSQKGEKE